MRLAILTGCCVLLLGACASAPAPEAPPTPAAPAPTAPADGVTKAGDVQTGSGSMQVRAQAPTTGKARPGYRLRTRNGETVYCRSETPTGSRMAVETCYTAAQLETIDQQTETFKDTVEQTRARCAGPTCGSGS
jgi:hypothetical protein